MNGPLLKWTDFSKSCLVMKWFPNFNSIQNAQNNFSYTTTAEDALFCKMPVFCSQKTLMITKGHQLALKIQQIEFLSS